MTTTGGGCPLCDSTERVALALRRGVPVHQNWPVSSSAEATAVPRGDLDLCGCAACGFAWNAAFDEQVPLYGPGYENAQEHSEVFAEHLRTRVSRIRLLAPARVVELGCGDGDFLRRLTEADTDVRALGLDPSYDGPASSPDGRLAFEQRYTRPDDPALAGADVVLSRHVIEHVPDPRSFLAAARLAMTSGARLALETPALEWILDGVVLHDLFYEHCSLFSRPALAFALERAGFSDITVEETFGGQYLWAEATAAPTATATAERGREVAGVVEAMARFAAAAGRTAAPTRDALRALGGNRVVVWGAGAKGVTFVNLHDQDATLVLALVDINPAKQGRFVPGTGHPIVAPDDLRELRPDTVIVMNPQYTSEVRDALRRQSIDCRLLDDHVRPALATDAAGAR